MNQYSWGIDPAQIVWKQGTTDEQKAQYKNIMSSLICTSFHSFPEPGNNGTFSDSTGSGYKVKPGITLFFTDGSSTTNIPDNYAWIYKPVQVTDSTIKNTFKTGDLSQFDSDSAKSHVKSVVPKFGESDSSGSNDDSSNWSFDTSYQWVVRDPNGTYTFNDAVDMRNTDEWVVWQNGHWAVANPSNSQGKQGVTITGFRALTKDDIKDAGKKKFYVLIGYTKNAKSGSEPGTYDGYYGIPQEIDVTLRGKVDVAKISGDGKQTVDYKGAAYDASNLDLSKFVPTITDVNSNSQIPDKTLTPTIGNELTTADYEIKGDPTNVGSYDVYLKTSGIDKIKQWTNADLYDWTGTEADVKVGTFTIDPAPVTISLDGSSTEGYKGVGYNKPDVRKLLQTSDTAIDLSSLSSSDFSWYASPTDTDPIKVQTKPFNVGTYYLKLNAIALAALQKNYPNYKLSFGKNNLYTFTVKPAIFTPNSMTGDYTITYGDAPEFSNQYKVGFKTDPLEVFGFTNPYTMGTAPAKYFQFKKQGTTDDWSTDKKFPTDAGTYDVTLSQDGWNALKDAKQYQNENVKLDVTDPTKLASTATFTIKAKVTFNFVDDDYKDAQGNADPNHVVSSQSQGIALGKTATIAPTLQVPDNYVLAAIQSDITLVDGKLPTEYALASDAGNTKTVEIHLKHATKHVDSTTPDIPEDIQKELKKDVTRTIEYRGLTNEQLGQIPAEQKGTQTVQFKGEGTYDLVDKKLIGDITWTANPESYAGFTPTAFSGYTPTIEIDSQPATSIGKFTPTADSANQTVKISYTANNQSVTINFEDSNDNNTVVDSASESGVTDQTITKFDNAQSKLTELEGKGYKLAEGQKIPTSYTFKASDNKPIVIKLVHKTTEISQATNKGASITGTTQTLQDAITDADVSKTVTRTINVTKPGESEATKVATQNVNFKQSAIVDMVTGKVTAYTGWKNADTDKTWAVYIPETVTGYIPIIKIDGTVNDSVSEVTPTADTPNSTVDITYTASATAKLSGSASSTYNGSAISWDDVNSTTDGNNITVTVTGPKDGSYKLQQGDVEFSLDGTNWSKDLPTNAGTYQIRWTSDGIKNIKNHFGNNSITWGTNDCDITGSATYTIKQATGKAVFGGNGTKTYDGSAIDYKPTVTITAPGTASSVDLTAGTDYVWYKANESGQPTEDAITTAPIDAGNYVVELTDAGKNKIKALNSANIDWTATDAVTGQGSYTINKAAATVTFTKNNQTAQSVKYTGSSQFDPSKFVPTIATNNDQSIPVTANLTISDFDFYNGTVKLDSEPTAVGNYTVKLNANGLAKLQTQSTFNNYNWANHASATYVIGKQTGVSVTISNVRNGQSEVYKGSAYTNANLNPADFKVTLGNGIEITLNDAKYWQFVPDQDPTNVGNYKVELSQAGKDYIASQQSGSYEYNFDSTGYGNFEITKATPTVVFNGVGFKTFGQNDTNWTTPTGLTITAPGNPTIALVAEDYEFVGSDGTVYSSIPTNVGTYTVRLSAKGKSLITGSNINSANLDWAKANISGEGTFTVKAVEGKAVLSGSNSRDYNGSAVTTGDINNGGNIVVSISIPGTDKTVSYKLQDGDYTWTNGTDPINKGNYTLELNKANILAHLQEAIKNDKDWNGNVTLADADLSGTASFEVKAKAATVSLSGDDTKNGPKYNGSAVSTPLDKLKNALSSNGTVNGEKLDLTDVTANGFDWYDAKGNKLDSVPTDHGVYTIKLNANGLSQIQTKNPNYKLSIDKNAYLFKIKTARGSVAFSGSHEVAFGTSDSNYSKDYTVKLTTDPASIKNLTPSFTLKDDDLEFSTDGKTWTTNVPTQVGTYKVKLTDKARDRIVDDNGLNGNVKWPATNFSGIGSYTIKAVVATAELSGKNSMTYSGDAATVSDVNGGTIGVTLNFPGVTDTNKVFKLTDASYYTWNTADSKSPKDVGNYTITLTAAGKTALQNYIDSIVGKGNVNLPSVSGSAEFDIDAKAITVTESGSGNKTYDGNAANVTVTNLTNNNNWSVTGMIGGQSFIITEGMALSDFDWYKVNADNSETKLDAAPTDAGNYAIKLNADGLKKLQDANKNYSFTAISGQYNYVINQANAEISLNETDNSQIATWTGSQIALDLSKFKPTIKDTSNTKDISYPSTLNLTAGDYTITQNGQAATAQEPGTYQIQLTEQGWQKVRDAISGHDNYKWTYSGNGVLTISRKTQAITISGSNNVIYSGSSAVIPTDNDGNLIGYTVNLGNGLTYQLKSGDLAFVDADHTNVGSYKLQLTEAGLDNIKNAAQGNHYDYQYTYNADNTATLTVDPATATYALSGNQNTVYTGSPASIDLSKDNSYSITITMNNGQTVTYQLKTEDLSFKSGSNPTARGKYDVVLSATGLQHLKAINVNYTWDADKSTSTATFEISPAEMHVDLAGEADTVYNGQVQPVPVDQLSNLHLVWGGSNDAPTGVTNITINADDFEYVQKQADGSYKVVQPKEHGEYILRLKQSAVDRLNAQNPTANYTFLLGNQSSAKYIINKLPAQITLSKSQIAEYTKAENLNVNNFEVQLTNTADGQPITITNLRPGDLLIDGYKQNEHPADVGTYKVKIQKQLIDRLKTKYPDYNFDEVTVRDASGKAVEGSIGKKNNDGLYIITAIDAFIKISGDNDSSYYNIAHNYQIDSSKYHVTLTDKFGNSISLPTGFIPKWKFVQNPTDAGEYEVTLDPSSITELEKIGTNNSNGLNNYQWIAKIVPASYEVKKLPVTATVSNKNSEPASSIYGATVDLNSHIGEYSITLVDTQNNQTLTYDGLTKDDLEFVNGLPENVGTYEVQLSKQGLEKIESKYPLKNYDITSVCTATYQIKAATPTVTITANGNSQKTYDAQPAEIKSGDFTVSITTNNGQTINTTLNSADLEFDGSAPTNVGQYDVKLKQSVIEQLKQQYPNYDWDADSVTKAVGKYTITAADGSAVLSGDVTKSYDGSAISDLSPIKVTVNYPGVGSNTTYTLTNDDYVIVNDQTNQQYVPNAAPADVGNHHIELTATGKANIAKLGNVEHQNINWNDQSYTGKATYTITVIPIAVSGQGKQNVTYDGTAFGTADKLDLSKFVPALKAGTVGVPTIPVDTLTADDYTIKNSKGETVTDPTNAGEYTAWLNENGLKKLKDLSSNFTWPTDPIKVGTLNIVQTDVTAKLSGTNSKTYDGQVVSTADINNGGNIKLQVTVNGKTYDYVLKDGDYTWDGGAPTDVGEYTDKIVLDTTGNLMRHLTEFINSQNRDLEGNFKIDAKNLTGSASFSITQKEATVTQKGSDSKIYDGTAGSVTLEQLINNLTSDDLVSGQNLKTSGLTLDDFAWSGADPNHIAAGTYTISLTPDGVAKLQADNPNYKLTVKGDFKYTINQATASAELSGSGEKTYNGDPVSDADIQSSNITVKVTIPGESTAQTVTLGVDDFDWSTPDGKAPTAAGDYTITLNDNGKKAIQDKFANNKNIDWSKTSFTGSATYAIKKDAGTINFTGSDSKIFDNKEVLPKDLDGNKFYATVNGQKVALPAGEYKFVDADGHEVTPKNAGTYYVVLTDKGLADLEKDTNYSWTPNWNGTTRPNQIGTFVINQAKATPTISGSNNKTFNGEATTLAEVTKDGKIKVSVDSGNTKFTIPDYVLTAGDYDWFGTDGRKISAPTNTSNYIIKLSQPGLQKLQDYLNQQYGQGNVIVNSPDTGTGQADFTIDPFAITVKINGSVTVDAGTTTIPDGKYNFTFEGTNSKQMPTGWTAPTIGTDKLSFDGAAPTATTQKGTFTVNYTGGQSALQQLLGKNYQVNYVAGKDNYIVAAQDQSVKIIFVDDDNHGSQVGPVITKDGKTGQQIDLGLTIPTNYVLANGQTLPTTYKFTSAKDQTITIHLVHEQVPDTDTKTITETVHYRFADGSQAAPDKVATVTFGRSGVRDLVTNEVSWGAWAPAGDQSFAAVDSPVISGYTPDQLTIPEQTVTVDSNNLEFTVVYSQNSQPDNPDVPVNPDQPVNPDNPNTPDQPTNPDQPSTPGNPTNPTNTVQPGKPGSLVKPGAGRPGQANAEKQGQLPQTGNGQKETMATAGLLFASLTGLFGFGGLKKKREER